MKKMHKLVSLCLALVLVGSLLAMPASAVTLSDIDSSWAKDVILFGVEKGYIGGFTDGTFRPNEPVTRAQFAKMLNNAIGIKNSAEPKFSDVTRTAWYYDEVGKAVCAQYIAGYNDGTFRPDANITRQEAAVMLSRIVTAPKTMLSSSQFEDGETIDTWAKSSVDFVYSKGYMKGDNHNRFDPKGKLTRAQAAQLIYSLLQGETIASAANEPIMVSSEGVLYPNHATVSSTTDVIMKNCRVLGTLSIGSTNTTLDGTVVNDLNVVGEDITVTATGGATVKATTVRAGTTLAEKLLTGDGFKDVALTGDLTAATVRLEGTFDTVETETGTVLRHTGGKIAEMKLTKKSNLTVQQGAVGTLTVDAAAAGSAMILSSDVTVENAELNGAAAFHGTGAIGVATENVAGCTYETEPAKRVENYSGGGSGTETSSVLVPTAVPARGAANVAVTGTVTLVFPEDIYTATGGTVGSSYLQTSVLSLRQGSASGTAVDFTAVVSGKTVTVTPSAPLADGATYYLTVAADKLKNAAGKGNTAFTTYFTTVSATAGTMTPTVTPANGATAVSTTAPIKVEFDSVLWNASGATLTNSYIENSVAELRVGSATGTLINYTAAIDETTRKSFTMQPDAALSMNTTYYVVLKNRTLRNEKSVYNTALTTSFTTGEQQTLQPTSVTPRDGAVSVSKTSNIVLTFGEKLYQSLGVALTTNYVRDNVVEIHEGSTTGPLVAFTVTLGNNNRQFTLKPNVVLTADTTYYVTVNAGTLVNAAGAVNSGFASRFSTGKETESDVVFDPENNATNVPVGGPFTITFPRKVVRPDSGNADLKASYVEGTAIELRRGSVSGTKETFTAAVSADGKTITITPTPDLAFKTKYCIVVAQGALAYEDGTRVGTANTAFTTEDTNPVTVTMIGEPTGTSATFSVKTDVAGSMTIRYSSGGKSTTVFDGMKFTAGQTFEYTATDLTPGSSCSVTATLNYNGTNYTKTENFKTSSAASSTQLEEVSLVTDAFTYAIVENGGTAKSIAVMETTGASLRIKPTEDTVKKVECAIGSNANTAYQELPKDGDAYTYTGLDIAKGSKITVYLRVTAQNDKTQNYSFTITCNA